MAPRRTDIAGRPPLPTADRAWPAPLRTYGRSLDPVLSAALAILLAGLFVSAYLGDPAVPGRAGNAAGGWAWFDQAAFLRSTAALFAFDLRPDQHHYPFLYSLMAAPFYAVTRVHPFFAVNLIALIAALSAFCALARRLGLWGPLAGALFVLATASDWMFLRQWVIPWNTVPAGAATWVLLALCAAWVDGIRRPVALGIAASVVVGCRPSDGVAILPCLLTVAATRPRWRDLLSAILGAALVLGPLIALHLLVFGQAATPYLHNSASIGFTTDDLGWKAYVIWVDPFAWFADGEGILERAPWIALGACGLVPALIRGPKDRMLAAALAIHAALYTSYVDLLPTGLWRFMNIHYFVWAIPGYALLAALLLRDLLQRGAPRLVAVGSAAATFLVLSLRVLPTPVPETDPAKAIDFTGPLPPSRTPSSANATG